MHRTRPRLLIAIAIAATASLALSACSNSPDGGSSGDSASASASDEPITLTLNNWGEFGFAPIIAQYEAEHPNITVQINNGDYNTQHQNLQKFLVAGSGAPDIAMSDEGYIVQFRGQADKFVDLNTLGAKDYNTKFLDWDWKSGTATSGQQFAIGDDVGGLAMCYRRDLFAKAGLPTDRAAVSALWPTWNGFIATGEKYLAGSGGKKFVDSGVNIFNPAMRQQKVGYFDTNDTLTMTRGRRSPGASRPTSSPRTCRRTSRPRRRSGAPGCRTVTTPFSPARRGCWPGSRAWHRPRPVSGTSRTCPVAVATGVARSS